MVRCALPFLALAPCAFAYVGGGTRTVQVTPREVRKQPSPPPCEEDAATAAVALEAELWTGLECRNVNEGFAELLLRGFAVFESEEAMFSDASSSSSSSSSSEIDDANEFHASWLKQAPPVDDLRRASPVRTAPLSAFARGLNYILARDDRGAFGAVGEEFVAAITVSGPITRGGGGGQQREATPHVFGLHQDPCFLSSLKQHAASSGTGGGLHGHVYPFDAVAKLQDDLVVRQVNFWLPHETSGDKHLLLLSREASCNLIGEIEGAQQSGLAVKNANGNRWLTRRGLREADRTMNPGNLHLVNKPLIFVSANADDASDAMYHCGALVPTSNDGEEQTRPWPSTELRVAVCSRRISNQ